MKRNQATESAYARQGEDDKVRFDLETAQKKKGRKVVRPIALERHHEGVGGNPLWEEVCTGRRESTCVPPYHVHKMKSLSKSSSIRRIFFDVVLL
jgi:hypothetical protein